MLLDRLSGVPQVIVTPAVPLASCTRFEIGGPAAFLVDAGSEDALAGALEVIRAAGAAVTLIGGGSNLLAADSGFPGVVLRYTASQIRIEGARVEVEAGALLQTLVDASIARGLAGLETMTGIPGWVGGAVYGNAGAYGHSIHERVETVRFYDGSGFRELNMAGCEFAYRESIFKRRKDWIVVSATLKLDPAESAQLGETAEEILTIRNQKYPATLRCAGSIFKNLMMAQLPSQVQAEVPHRVVREGKVPSAYFLEQVGAKGMSVGPIRVADYHANLIYNLGGGLEAQVSSLIAVLKDRVFSRFGVCLEEEVQMIKSSSLEPTGVSLSGSSKLDRGEPQ